MPHGRVDGVRRGGENGILVRGPAVGQGPFRKTGGARPEKSVRTPLNAERAAAWQIFYLDSIAAIEVILRVRQRGYMHT